MDELIAICSEKLKELPPVIKYEADYVPEEIPAESDRETIIKNVNGTYYIEGDWIYKVMGSINFDDRESLMYFQRVLKNSGVIKMLEEKGCKDGDTVNIYDFEFDFVS